MARKRAAAVAELSDTDLVEHLAEARDDLFKLRFQVVTGQLDNSARIGVAKREVARALTERRVREIAAAEAAAER